MTTPIIQDACGTVDPEWLSRWLDQRGPWAFHVTKASFVSEIMSSGLVPWDEHGTASAFRVAATPRPGCVYFVTEPWECDHQWELSQVDPREGAVICADLRGISPERILPDEDPWALGVLDPWDRRWELSSDISKQSATGDAGARQRSGPHPRGSVISPASSSGLCLSGAGSQSRARCFRNCLRSLAVTATADGQFRRKAAFERARPRNPPAFESRRKPGTMRDE